MRIASNIEWEVDNEDIIDELELPDEVEIPNEIHEDDITDYLSDEYGFLVRSYDLEDFLECPYCLGTMIVDSKNGLNRCLECGNEF
jgi:hypothetical protein